MVGEPFNKRSVPCAFGIKIGLYFQKIPFTFVNGIFTSYLLPLHSYLKIKSTLKLNAPQSPLFANAKEGSLFTPLNYLFLIFSTGFSSTVNSATPPTIAIPAFIRVEA